MGCRSGFFKTFDLIVGFKIEFNWRPPRRICPQCGTTKLGEGWRATDNQLGRDVALKILPASFASDLGRMARFEREAKALASLNRDLLQIGVRR